MPKFQLKKKETPLSNLSEQQLKELWYQQQNKIEQAIAQQAEIDLELVRRRERDSKS